MVSQANPITSGKAMQKAAGFLSQSKAKRVKGDVGLQQAYAMPRPSRHGADSYPAIYTFNIGNGDGFVIMSGDDVAPDVLGYCDKGRFNFDSIPCNMRFWLEMCASRIAMASARGVSLKRSATTTADGRVDVPPLISVNWNQLEPYNDQCIFNGDSCLTGCVATAMAQVDYFWGKGRSGRHFGHGCDALENYADMLHQIPALDAIDSFGWEAMTMDDNGEPDTDASKAAVAQLMRYCGQAVKMWYTPVGSGASLSEVPDVFNNHFGYKGQAKRKVESHYTTSAWNKMLYEELLKGYPLILAGIPGDDSSDEPMSGHLLDGEEDESLNGHAFVCDGYEAGTDRFHINWGWGGEFNGYFLLDFLNPALEGIPPEDILADTGDEPDSENPLPYLIDHCYHQLEAVIGLSPWQDYAITNGEVLTYYFDGEKDSREDSSTGTTTKIVFDDSYADCRGSKRIFGWCNPQAIIGLENYNTSMLTSMEMMFEDCSNLQELDVSHFNTSNVRNMSCMFRNCGTTALDVSHFDVSNVTDMSDMFENCWRLERVKIGSFDTSNVTDMSDMFSGCKSLKALNLSEIVIGENTKTDGMLYNLTSLDSLAISRTMYRLDDKACMNTGTPQHPCTIYAPEGFYFGTATDGPYFRWKSGCFRRPGTYVLGDVNHDGCVNVVDVTLIIDHVLGNAPGDFHAVNADLDEDGYINVVDVTQVINIILNK